MRIAVIGAGIVGVTTAYELAANGHEVTVFDRRGGVASESSFAIAGFVSPGYVTPWAAPGMRAKVLRHLFSTHAPVRWHPSTDPAQWRWIARWWKACNADAYGRNRRALFELARMSQSRLAELSKAHGLDYERTGGVLVLLRSQEDVRLARGGLEALRDLGVNVRELDAAEARRVEPDLNVQEPLAAALHLPGDEVGNCRQFAHLLRDIAEDRHGVDFRFAADVTHIEPRGGAPRLRIEQLALTTGFASNHATSSTAAARTMIERRAQAAARYLAPVSEEDFDAVVICAGASAAGLLRSLKIRIPLMPVHGYSATFALRIPEHGPRSGLMDERYKVAISRMGARVRVAGSAEVGGDPERHHPGALRTLYKVLDDWFPGAAHQPRAQIWKGARPMLPDGPPLIGPSGIPGIWMNVGHGSSGWALSAGSASLLADMVADRAPALDATPFRATRYGH